jgi:subtilisin family serine protease
MPLQISDAYGNMTLSAILDGIFYALKNDANVINLSLGADLAHLRGTSRDDQETIASSYGMGEAAMWDEVYTIAASENTMIVQAAGNDAILAEVDPMKRSENSLIVGAVGKNKELTDFSNIGNYVNVFAPGDAIYSSVPGNDFAFYPGTSMACPIVAGCVGLLKSLKPEILNKDIIKLITDTGEPVAGVEGVLIRIDKILESIQ